MLSGKPDSGAEKKEEEHQEFSMTSYKLCQRDDTLSIGGKLVSLSCIEGQKSRIR